MGKYWLLDRNGVDGPTALVETDGSLHIIDVLRFGTTVTGLEDQQQIWDDVIGRVAPTMKPLVAAAKVAEKGIDLHADLNTGDERGSNSGDRDGGGEGPAAGRVARSARRTGGRGRG